MKKLLALLLVFSLILSPTANAAISWTKSWDSSDDGSTWSGSDIENMQDDISTQVPTLTGTNIFTGTNTFSGTVSGIGSARDAILRGFEIQDVAGDDTSIVVQAGVLFHNDTEVSKTSNTTLTFATAGDWWDGSADSFGSAAFNYVGVDVSGNVKFLGTNPADKADTSGNTDGLHVYWFDAAKYWRVIGEVYMDTDDKAHAAGHIQQGNAIMYDIPINVTTSTSSGTWSSATAVIMPSTSSMGIFGLLTQEGSGTTAGLWIRPNGSTWATENSNGVFMQISASGNVYIGGQRVCATDGSQQIQYQNESGDDNIRVDVEGYISNLR